MSFDSAAYLRRATGRTKSDVANKLISMFLHEVSKRVCSKLGLSVSHPVYTKSVSTIFGARCSYCGSGLEKDRAAVEHPDGMNRFRLGLHIPGNVILACTRCNREKRRDDSALTLTLARSGWESFLSHDGTACEESCKSCAYWEQIWPTDQSRQEHLESARTKLQLFREDYRGFIDLNVRARAVLATRIDEIYKECQNFAESRIKGSVEALIPRLL